MTFQVFVNRVPGPTTDPSGMVTSSTSCAQLQRVATLVPDPLDPPEPPPLLPSPEMAVASVAVGGKAVVGNGVSVADGVGLDSDSGVFVGIIWFVGVEVNSNGFSIEDPVAVGMMSSKVGDIFNTGSVSAAASVLAAIAATVA